MKDRTRALDVRVATAPVNWNNEDLAGYRPFTPFAELLAQMKAAGYDWTEWGPGFPEDRDAVRAELGRAGLGLTGSFCAVAFHDSGAMGPGAARALERSRMLVDLGASTVLLSGAITPERSAWAGRADEPGAPRLDASERRAMGRRIEELALRIRELGLEVAFHHHVGTYVETPQEVQALLESTDPAAVGLCLDTGHLSYGGGDPVTLLKEHADRVNYVHLKDVDPDKLQRFRREGLSFPQALAGLIFPNLGQGMVDFDACLSLLGAAGYRGVIVVEQDTCAGEPVDAARANRAFLRERFGI